MNSPRLTHGFTLIELLISMAILGVLMLAFTQIFGGSLRASSEINSRNELISEGQVAQQLIASRLQGAYYLYAGTLQLTDSATTTNTVRSGAGQNWTIGTDPFVAMLVPPTSIGTCQSGQTQNCFTFYAYYPMLRSSLISAVPASSPPADPNNANTWVLMEYRANIVDNVNRNSTTTNCLTGQGQGQLSCPPLPGTTYGTGYFGDGRSGKMLVDYVQPTTSTPTYTMFSICKPAASTALPCPTGTTTSSPSQIDFDLRFLKNRGSKTISAPSSTAPLSTHIYPRNLQ